MGLLAFFGVPQFRGMTPPFSAVLAGSVLPSTVMSSWGGVYPVPLVLSTIHSSPSHAGALASGCRGSSCAQSLVRVQEGISGVQPCCRGAGEWAWLQGPPRAGLPPPPSSFPSQAAAAAECSALWQDAQRPLRPRRCWGRNQ